MTPRITLVRHGRSAHAPLRALAPADLPPWIAGYDATGLAPGEAPPARLLAWARRVPLVVASDLPRARESAALLRPDGEVVVSPLLRELPIPFPTWPALRLPLGAWAVVMGAHALARRLRVAPVPALHAENAARADAAAAWLVERASVHGEVMAVTHGWVRGHILRALVARGWRAPRWRSQRLWSAWTLEVR